MSFAYCLRCCDVSEVMSVQTSEGENQIQCSSAHNGKVKTKKAKEKLRCPESEKLQEREVLRDGMPEDLGMQMGRGKLNISCDILTDEYKHLDCTSGTYETKKLPIPTDFDGYCVRTQKLH